MENNGQRTDVSHQEMGTLPYIIAVDFDGTLVEDKFPAVGNPINEVWSDVFEARRRGAKIILWTCRDGQNLIDAVEFCKSKGMVFDAVNTNIDETKQMFNNDTRKVYANEYWDDKAVTWYSDMCSSKKVGCKRRFGDSLLSSAT